MYAAVPRIIPMPVIIAGVVIVGDAVTLADVVGVGSSALASPKSKTFTVPSGRSLMLAGFRSRWMMPCLVGRFERVRDLLRDRQRFVGRDRTRAIRSARRRAFHELQHQRAHAVRFFQPVDRARCSGDSARRAPALRVESREAVGIGGKDSGRTLSATSRPSFVSARDTPRPYRPRRAPQRFHSAESSPRRKGHESWMNWRTLHFRRRRESGAALRRLSRFFARNASRSARSRARGTPHGCRPAVVPKT